jgi:curved DNA-binding protein CbpA
MLASASTFALRLERLAQYGPSVLNDLQDSYRVLELEPGATLEDAKRSYRELVKVWHPDRFANDPRLQKKAQEKLKEINLAYERICNGEKAEPRRRPSSGRASARHAEEQARAAGDTTSPGSRRDPQKEEPRQSPPPPPQTAPPQKTS